MEAIRYFEQALEILDQIREDSGIARERVMEKLSEAAECLQLKRVFKKKGKRREVDKEPPRFRLNSKEIVNAKNNSDDSSSEEEDENHPIAPRLTRSLGAEFANAEVDDIGDKKVYNKSNSITERRGVESLPPIKTTRGNKLGQPSRKHVVVAAKKRKGKEVMVHVNGDSEKNYDDNLQAAYLDSYRDPVTSSSQESLTTAMKRTNGSLYRHSLPASSTKRLSITSPREGTPASIKLPPEHPRQQQESYVREGSLAIGPNARENFRVQTVDKEEYIRKKGRKRRLTKDDIIVASPGPISAPAIVEEDNKPNHQSKICAIL